VLSLNRCRIVPGREEIEATLRRAIVHADQEFGPGNHLRPDLEAMLEALSRAATSEAEAGGSTGGGGSSLSNSLNTQGSGARSGNTGITSGQ
jgi:hypothetical protein